MKLLKYFILCLNILMVGVIILCYLTPFISPGKNPYIPAFGLIYPIMFMIHVGFIILWFFIKKKFAIISIVTLLIGFSAFGRMMSFKSDIQKADAKNIFTVNSYNIAQLQLVDKNKEAEFYKHIGDLVDNGIFFFQEMNSSIYEKMKQRFKDAHFAYFPRKSTLIISSYPIINKDNLNISSSTNSCIYVDVSVDNKKKIRFYNAHLQSNTITGLVNQVNINTGINDEKNWNNVGAILRRYSEATKMRLQQIDIIKKHASECPFPYVLGGDMNDVPQSYAYKKLSKDVKDGFIERGFGLGTTFSGRIPTLRIDYLFCNEGLRFLSFVTHRNKYSDHYRISARLELK